MENTDLLNDTIIAEALAYDGEIEEIVIREEDILPGKVIDTMSEFEKRLHTLSVLKHIEIQMMFENIMGSKPINSSEKENIKELSGIITYEKNLHYYEKFDLLQREAEACDKLMWMLIYLRVKSNHSVLSIRPGFKIVAINNTENFLNPGGSGLINFS